MNEMLGLWLESLGANPALAEREGLVEAVRFAKEAGVTDLYLQIYREGRAWFPSQIAGQEHLKLCLDRGHDPLGEALALAEQNHLRVHAWINVFNLGRNSGAKILHDHGNDILLTDNCGIRVDAYTDNGKPPDSRADFFVLDAPKLWLDPAAPAVKEYLGTLAQEIFSSYPTFSGLHLDFFRYPYFLPMQPSSRIGCGFEVGYGAQTMKSFEATLGEEGAFILDEKKALRPASEGISLRWDCWRREQIESYLVRFRSALPKGAGLSVAALAWPDRAYFTAYQNWRRWLTEDAIDQACLMAYTADDELFSFLIRQAVAFQGARSAVIAGAGVYLHSHADQLARQICSAQAAGAKGALIFSYENLRKKGIDSSTLSKLLAQRRRME